MTGTPRDEEKGEDADAEERWDKLFDDSSATMPWPLLTLWPLERAEVAGGGLPKALTRSLYAWHGSLH